MMNRSLICMDCHVVPSWSERFFFNSGRFKAKTAKSNEKREIEFVHIILWTIVSA